jgi:uncharacterized membrane protein
MALQNVLTAAEESSVLPQVRKIGLGDLKDALAKGLDDFWAMPTHVVFVSLLYPVVGLILGRLTLGYDLLPLLYPLAAGFALVGPFVAIWLYELSRRRERGLDVHWRHALDILHSPSLGAIAALGGVLIVIFLVWLATAHAIYVANFGYARPSSITEFVRQVLTTEEGLNLIIVGNLVGSVFAVLAFIVSVISFPLLLDRNVSASAAMLTSIRAVIANPFVMAVWGFIIALALAVGSLPFFFGLAVVVPILGHASWHLYRKVVEPNPNPVIERPRRRRPHRYAADFPAALFPTRDKEGR